MSDNTVDATNLTVEERTATDPANATAILNGAPAVADPNPPIAPVVINPNEYSGKGLVAEEGMVETRLTAIEAQIAALSDKFNAMPGQSEDRIAKLENTVAAIEEGIRHLSPDGNASMLEKFTSYERSLQRLNQRIFGVDG